MPFGLQLKSMIVGALIAYFVLPWLLGLIRPKATQA
jgi:hypothetical protein